MVVEKLLALVPEALLTELAVETKVDYYAKKLQGGLLFKLLLHCLLTSKETSLRSAASAYESIVFSALNAAFVKNPGIHYSAISQRLSKVNPDFFIKLYEHCVSTYKQTIGKDDAEFQKLLRFDSTIVALCGKLLRDVGYQLKGGSAEHLRQIKFTIGLSTIPEVAACYTAQSYNSENKALKETIINHAAGSDSDQVQQIVVFDRGITSRATYDALSARGIRFVSRIRAGAKHTALSANRMGYVADDVTAGSGSVLIKEDIDVRLYAEHGAATVAYLRCIKGQKWEQQGAEKEQEELWFITNIEAGEISASEVAAIYKRRWDIEVFFKFLKQHLNFSHLISRSENGISVMFFVTMIAAVLIMAYKKLGKVSGYKMAKQKMAQELETLMLKTIITICGGDPDALQKILNTNSS